MKYGVLFGSFDPIHKGHLTMVKHALDNHFVDKVLIIPTNDYWDKHIKTSLEKRIEILKHYENEFIIVETDFSNCKYSIDLICALKGKYPNDELVIMMGADNFAELDKWHRYKELLDNNILVFKRNEIGENEIADLCKKYNAKKVLVAEIDKMDISSTEIRKNFDSNIETNMVDDFIKKYY